MTAQKAIGEITAYIQNNGGGYSAWYVGIAADPEDRLFNSHALNKDSDLWIYCPCDNSEEARLAESYFLDKLGTCGGPGGGDNGTDHVYAYKVAQHTVEST